ncbi:MAG: ComEC family competence protein [Candidatus Taylorbacteria bacterium]|nr:ComEC family competence protein [Candidatus Taylorbacteria bacterium]
MSSRSFYCASLSFFAGVLVSSLSISRGPLLAGIILLIALALVSSRGRAKPLLLCLLCAVAFGSGFLRMAGFGESGHPLDAHVGEVASLSGTVCSEPEERDTAQRFCFAPESSPDRVLVTAARYPLYSYGDRLSASGKLSSPRNFEAYEGGPEFDYVSYLAKEGIRYTMFMPHIELSGRDQGHGLLRTLYAAKRSFVERMQFLFPEPESSLLGGLLLGEKDSLPKDVVEDFKDAGLVHILVLSGYNVTIVAESLMKAFSFLPRTFGRSAGALSIVLFAVMTGASATTVRASVMALIVLLAKSASRRYDITRALITAAFFMVLHNPSILAFDMSFQLSFLATLGLIYVAPLALERLGFVTERFKLREVAAATVGTQVAVLPFLMHAMGQVSLISLVTNLLVLPFVPYAMLGGFGAIALGSVSSAIAFPLAWATSLVLSYMIRVAAVFAQVPFASIQATASAGALAVVYVFMAASLIRAWRRRGSSQPSAS